jgi:acyl-CoA thioesterase-2
MNAESDPLAHWLASLDLEPAGPASFVSPPGEPNPPRRWGSGLMAQSLVAAARTTTLRTAHSLNMQFIRPATMTEAVTYEVESLSDGRRLVRRLVRAIQAGKIVSVAAVTLGEPAADGTDIFDHRLDMPKAPDPESMDDWWEPLVKRLNLTPAPNPWELRSVGLEHPARQPGERPWRRTWARPKGTLPDDPLVHAAAILAVSDRAFTATTGLAYGKPAMTSLDHAMWWHAQPKFDGWMLFSSDSPNGTGGRTLTHGAFHTPDGRHIASVAQEAMSLSGLNRRQPA